MLSIEEQEELRKNHRLGLKLAALLDLKRSNRGIHKGRFLTTHGSKTPVGLALSIKEVINETN